MEIKSIEIKNIKPYENNPRKNDDAVEAVARSIKEFGFKVPIILDENNVIVAGHTRYKAAKKLEMTEVPCVIASDLTPEQIKAFRLADNKVAEQAEWDFVLLKEELEGIETIDMELFGFDEFEEIDTADAVDDDFEVDPPEEPKSKRGQIYQLGKHRLMVGDSTSAADVEKLMNGEKADLVDMDPPYNVALGKHMRPSEAKALHRRTDGLVIDNDDMEEGQFIEFLKSAFQNAMDALKPGAAFYIWHADNQSLNFRTAAKEIGMQIRQCLIWNKNTFAMGRQDYQWKHEPCLYGWKEGAAHYFIDDRTQTTVIDAEPLDFNKMKKDELVELLEKIYAETQTTVLNEKKPAKSELHPTMKPIPLIAGQIKNSTKPKEKVLDLFGGSGTTLMACEQMNRQCFMMEYDPRYADVIIERWETYTGEKAELINGNQGAN